MACSGIGGIVAALIIDRFLSFETHEGMLLVANVVSLARNTARHRQQ